MKTQFVLSVLGVLALCGCTPRRAATAPPSPPPVSVSDVRNLGRMEFAEMTVTKMGTIDDLKLGDARSPGEKMRALVNAVKIGERKGAWSYDTYLRAYIDLQSLGADDLEVDTVARTVSLRLPPVRTEIIGRDIPMREEHYRVSGLRSNISAAERAALKEQMNAMLRREIEDNAEFEQSLTSRARARATAYFDSLFSTRGYTAQISFK